MSIYDHSFAVNTIQGKPLDLSEFKGKVTLVVNTASKCGLTPQYEGLEKIYSEYKDRGFTVLGFPCNQFAGQEPGDEKSIQEGCLLNYGVTFPMFSKIEVNGTNTHPLFKFLKKKLGGFLGSKIKWNFTKFLIDQNGTPIKRYSPQTEPEDLCKDIEKLLATS